MGAAMTIEGYFDGKTFVPLEKLSLKPNQKVQITVLDEFLTSEKQKQISRKHGKNGNKKYCAKHAQKRVYKGQGFMQSTRMHTQTICA